ncbi:meiotic recombination (DMC1-like) protein, putative [Theileria annulata]|uniref:Meiotic recombination (DMC1-like) protein, putative n=1 Tax=Theileria annulata TaxID=5874 RepID=Q4UAC7_THEAN|nr:meiotic recombination (DMC1-like) protein, putative [Theileria annulata]CAI76224.1 meiotic recombination (DMC1-like) protein, putative [Theileria annulata]|eukprot:XP_952849.1 meiotic recombination (DMC1-like) protein, putative [Theileria annulata]
MVTVPITKSKGVTIQSSTDTITKPFLPIERLEEMGINVSDINKLKSAGICTILGVIQTTKKDLCNIKGLTEMKVEKISDSASKLEITNSFISANQLYQLRKSILKIDTGIIYYLWFPLRCLVQRNQFHQPQKGYFSYIPLVLLSYIPILVSYIVKGVVSWLVIPLTGYRLSKHRNAVLGSEMLNKLLNGGIETMSITELFGENRTEKIEKICERFDLDPIIILDNIFYSKAYTHEHLLFLINNITTKMVEERFVLLIIDSIISLFRIDYSGRGELAERQQKLNKLLSNLLKIAQQFNIAIVLTNHVISEPSGNLSFISNPTKPGFHYGACSHGSQYHYLVIPVRGSLIPEGVPLTPERASTVMEYLAGGNVIGHASTCRLSLRKGKGNQRICKVYDSPNLPESECIFEL